MAQPFDVIDVRIQFSNCADIRPFLIVEVLHAGMVSGFPIASECYHGGCFYVDESHPDFTATGLTKSCNVHDSHLVVVNLQAKVRDRGSFTNALLSEFREYAGV